MRAYPSCNAGSFATSLVGAMAVVRWQGLKFATRLLGHLDVLAAHRNSASNGRSDDPYRRQRATDSL